MPSFDEHSVVSKMQILFLAFVVFCLALPEDEKYSAKYDNVNVDEILQSDRLLQHYMNCFLDKGRCTPLGKELKERLPEILESGCNKCNPHQQKIGIKVIKFLIEQRREYYDKLEAKYDPNRIYRKKYEAEIKREGIKF